MSCALVLLNPMALVIVGSVTLMAEERYASHVSDFSVCSLTMISVRE